MATPEALFSSRAGALVVVLLTDWIEYTVDSDVVLEVDGPRTFIRLLSCARVRLSLQQYAGGWDLLTVQACPFGTKTGLMRTAGLCRCHGKEHITVVVERFGHGTSRTH